MEFYESLSPYYDLIFPLDTETVLFLDGLVRPGAGILDLACGTGSYSLALAGRGHRLTGIDSDQSMVEAALEKSRRQGPGTAPRFAVMDMLDIGTELEAGFDLVFCIGNSLVHLDSEDQIARVLGACRSLLAAGGSLVVQIINYDRVIEQGVSFLPTLRDQSGALELERRYEHDPTGRTVIFRATLRICEGGKRCSISNRQRLLMLGSAQLLRLVEQAGFGDLRLYGGFDRRPFSLDALPLVLSARRD